VAPVAMPRLDGALALVAGIVCIADALLALRSLIVGRVVPGCQRRRVEHGRLQPASAGRAAAKMDLPVSRGADDSGGLLRQRRAARQWRAADAVGTWNESERNHRGCVVPGLARSATST